MPHQAPQNTTCDIYNGFAGALRTANVTCGLVPSLCCGRGGSSGGNYVLWTHYLDVADTVDIRDGRSRASGLDTISYADGDQVRIPTGGTTKYVVVHVEVINRGGLVPWKRAYLLRHSVTWPGP